ncbi:MAG: DUF362 domain-containing protein [Oscillospiraceae bacterium]|nr:DUF362 domain-containing protein [Oscillospiraceae bacterium]
MSDVSIVRCEEYELEGCTRALLAAMEPFGGLDWVKEGMRIVIKANLVEAMKPEKAGTTHPVLLTALTKLLKEKGAHVVIGDSPGQLFNATVLNHVYAVCGLGEAEAAGAELNRNFEQKSVFFPEAKVAKSFTVTDYLENADAIISFCKLKSHGMMTMTAATKNLFGAVPGTMKPEYHFRFHNPMDFADMILDLNEYFKPRLYLVDAIMGMEGNGPTAGTPRKIGAVLAAENCHKLDLVCAKLIGAEPMAVPTLKAAFDRGLCPQSAEEVEVQGELCPVEGFVLPPQNKSLQFENFLPGKLGVVFGKIAKKALQASPKLKEPDACIGCLRCARLCPAKAITMVKKKPKIDKKKCIRCFCCQEFCPKGALKVHRPLIARILNR